MSEQSERVEEHGEDQSNASLNFDKSGRSGSILRAGSVIADPQTLREIALLSVDWKEVLRDLQREKKKLIAREEEQYLNRSLFCLESSSSIREAFIKIAEWEWFNRTVLGFIILNCILLVLDDPVCSCAASVCIENDSYKRIFYTRLGDCSSWSNVQPLLQVTEYLFTCLFSMEMVIKIIARGFVLHKHAYLRDPWNWIDFVVVICSLISLVPGLIQNVTVLRVARILRPLRTMTRIKGMQPLIKTVISSLRALTNVVLLLAFMMTVFGILALELAAGQLRGRCYVDPTPGANNFSESARTILMSQQIPYIAEAYNMIGSYNAGISFCNSLNPCPQFAIDGVYYNSVCSFKKWCYHDWCSEWNNNPFYEGGGYLSFDNFLECLVVLWETLTLEGWTTDLLYNYQASWGDWSARIYFVMWVLVGTFFVLQLALAVLSDAYLQAVEEEKSEKEMEALHEEAILKPNDNQYKSGGRKSSKVLETINMLSSIRVSWKHISLGKKLDEKLVSWAGKIRSIVRLVVFNSFFVNLITVAIICNSIVMAMYFHDQTLYETNICKRRCALDPSLPANASDYCVGPLFNRTWDTDGQGGGMRPDQNIFCFLTDDALIWPNSKSICSTKTNPVDCANEAGRTGLGCFFTGSGTCQLGLYTAATFSYQQGILPSSPVKISLRQLCGDDLSQCPDFPTSLNAVLDNVNLSLTIIFVIEMVLKWIALGFKQYFSDGFNVFDCFVVIASTVELIIGALSTSGSNGSSLSALRGLRILRLLRLAKSWEEMRRIMTSLGRAISSLGPVTIFWVMFMYMFALLAMQFFGGNLKYNKTDSPRSNFDSFVPSELGHGSFFIVFQIISTENWNTIMYNSMTAVGSSSPWNCLLTIFIVAFGNYIVMNLFISILLQGFGETDGEEGGKKENKSLASKMAAGFRKILANVTKKAKEMPRRLSTEFQQKLRATSAETQEALAFAASIRIHPEATSDGESEDPNLFMSIRFFGKNRKLKIANHRSFFILPRKHPVRVFVAFCIQNPIFETFILLCILITSVTLLIESPDASFIAAACPLPPERLDCTGSAAIPGQTVNINCPRNALDTNFGILWDPCNATSAPGRTVNIPPCCSIAYENNILSTMDVVFTLVFFSEMILKLIVDGLLFHQYAYLRDSWNCLDCFVVVISMLSSFGSAASAKSFKVLRALRALRPLRVIKRNKSLKIAVVCLLSSIPAMMNVMVVVLFWFVIYAMLGVQFFRGKLYRCVDVANQIFYGTAYFPLGNLYTPAPLMAGNTSVPTIIECVSAGTDGTSPTSSGVWLDKDYSFDNLAEALSTLFQMSTTEGWMDVMSAAVDVVEVGVTPIPNQNPWFSLYCVVHIILGAFILLNLIVAEVIKNYIRIKSMNDGITPFLTPEQQEWKEMRRAISSLKPLKRREGPSNKFRSFFYHLINHAWFEYFITFSICANVIVMLMNTYNQDECVVAIIFWINFSFSCVFVTEAVLKLIGLGPKWYFTDKWNILDFLVVLISVSTLSIEFLRGDYSCAVSGSVSVSFPGLKPLRALRIVRVFRLVRRSKGIRQMIVTLLESMPSLWNIGVVLFLSLIIFAVMGVNLFYNVNTGQDVYGRMSDLASYSSLDSAIFLLFRQTTGEAWNGIMFYCMESDQYKACSKCYGPYLGDGCGNQWEGIIFHVMWQILGAYVLVQLFTAVIIENFAELSKEESSVLPMDKLQEFVEVWMELDPGAKGRISVTLVPELIKKLSPPLGLKREHITEPMLIKVIKDLHIPVHGEHVRYYDTFAACVKRVLSGGDLGQDDEMDHQLGDETNDKSETGMKGKDEQAPHKEGSMVVAEPTTMHDGGRTATAAEDYASRCLQRAYREWKERSLQVQKGQNFEAQLRLSLQAR